jgi:hypothetical protein
VPEVAGQETLRSLRAHRVPEDASLRKEPGDYSRSEAQEGLSDPAAAAATTSYSMHKTGSGAPGDHLPAGHHLPAGDSGPAQGASCAGARTWGIVGCQDRV